MIKSFPQKIRWLFDRNENINLFFNGEKLRKIKKDIVFLKENNILYGTKKLNKRDLEEFYNELYIIEIGTKNNFKIFNLIEIIGKDISSGVEVYFSYIKQNNKLIGGAIIYIIDKMLVLGYKASNEKIFKLKNGIGTLLDYLFLNFGVENKNLDFDYFSLGKDRNGYGEFGAEITLANHKLRYGFLPYISQGDGYMNFVLDTIKTDTLFFYNDENEKLLKNIIIYRVGNSQKIDLNLLQKRGFNYTIINL